MVGMNVFVSWILWWEGYMNKKEEIKPEPQLNDKKNPLLGHF